MSSDVENWMDKITNVTVNGTEYTKVSYSFSMTEKTYYLIKNDGNLRFGAGATVEGENTVVISAEGYEDCTVSFTK